MLDTPISDKCVPFFNLNVAAGEFLSSPKDYNVHYIEIEEYMYNSADFFACQITGESMNKIIPNNSVVLFKKYSGGSRNGEICLVQSTDIQDPDTGGEFTVKEYESKKAYDIDGWEHSEIILKPRSYDKSYKNIVLKSDEITDFKVVGIYVRVLGEF